MRVIPQESLKNTFAFFHITRKVGATALSLIAKRRKMNDSGISFQDKAVTHNNSLCWQITHHTEEK